MNNKKHLSDIEWTTLETVLKERLSVDTRNCLMLLVAMKTGARAGEVLAIRKQDLDKESQTVFIQGLKGSKDRQIPIEKSIFKALQRYSEQVQTERIFPLSYETLREVWYTYRPVKKKLHTLRHNFALMVYKRTGNIHLVKTVLGHSNITTSMLYLDYVESQKDLRKALL